MNSYFDIKVYRNGVLDGTVTGIDTEDAADMLSVTDADVAGILWTVVNQHNDGPVIHEETFDGETIRYEITESVSVVAA